MNPNIFNTEKQNHRDYPLFLGESLGLLDTVNKSYPEIDRLYRIMRKQDWSEDEFDFSQCNADFKGCDKTTADMMIETIAWQWEADSIASRSIVSILAPFITSSELWAYITREAEQEVVHAATYSEAVRMSFDNPDEVLSSILSSTESIRRLETVGQVFSDAHLASHQYALGLLENNQELFNKVYMVMIAKLLLERIQFMASFANTYIITETGIFRQFNVAVQRIAQDELEVHSEFDKVVLNILHKTERGRIARQQLSGDITRLFNEVIQSEYRFIDYLFRDGRSLVGTNPDILKQWVLFNAKDVDRFLGLNLDYQYPKENPIPAMALWLNMNMTQPTPQEAPHSAYKVGVRMDNDEGIAFACDW